MPFYLILAQHLLEHYADKDVHFYLVADFGPKNGRRRATVSGALFELAGKKLIYDTGRDYYSKRGKASDIYRIHADRITEELARHLQAKQVTERNRVEEKIGTYQRELDQQAHEKWLTTICNQLSAALDRCTQRRAVSA